jgi:hypothetical protein
MKSMELRWGLKVWRRRNSDRELVMLDIVLSAAVADLQRPDAVNRATERR